MKKLIGDTVTIQHQSTQDKFGVARLGGAARFSVSKIKLLYGSGRVMLESGDTFRIVPFSNGPTKWVTSVEA